MIYQNIEASATTIWELWDTPVESPHMDSRNHPAFSSVGKLCKLIVIILLGAWYYKALAGINQPEPVPMISQNGYKSVIISPPPVSVLLYSTLTSVHATVNLGAAGLDTIASSWSKTGGRLCAMAPENGQLSFNCGNGVIQKVIFASFGYPYHLQNYSIASFSEIIVLLLEMSGLTV
jgi:hypothetical protein